MKHVQALMLCALVMGAASTITQAKEAPKPTQASASAAGTLTADAKPAKSDRGQQVFAQNCSRCHNSPEGFSSHISGTIARHMRVRAGLSDEDYKALRHFLNP
jgi:mono/diheme cytochrome c family protein